MEDKLQELKNRLAEIDDLQKVNSLLVWDQNTHMPPGGGEARARQSSTLARLAHEKFIDPKLGKLLDDLQPYGESLDYDSDEASLIRITRRDYERAVRIPPEFTVELYSNAMRTYQLWTQARPANDFARVRPALEKTLDLSRKLADFFPGYEHIADPLIDEYDYGMKASTVRSLFNELRRELVPIVQAVTAQPPANDACVRQNFPEAQQLAFGNQVIQQLGYDFERGRVDKTHHPFMIQISMGDVRITTRVKEDFLNDNLFSMIHETGHALYEQGIHKDLEGTPLAGGASSGLHESQSRLWENLVGRSRGFWEYFYPRLQNVFPEQFRTVSFDEFYPAINRVQPSLIRVDADEVTYNLHVMLRFDFELALLEGSLEVSDLPDAWRERFQADFGIQPPDDRDGVLQDVHWYSGQIGGVFQGYTLGNILAAQFYDEALNVHPEIPAEIQSGQFTTLHGWLKDNIYQHGSKFTPAELVQRVTGGPIRIEPYLRYLRTKYGELYSL